MNLEPSPHHITSLKPNEVFVFGSNLAGRHGAGAALQAKKFGARNGEGIGRWGRTYAIPTKDEHLHVLPLREIKTYVLEFKAYVLHYASNIFLVTPIGCGLAGYKPEDIAPMFAGAPDNVRLPECFLDVLGGKP